MLVIGHLGNTLDAFARVQAAGVDGVELDVRRATDGSLRAHHDPVPDPLPADAPTLADALTRCSGLIVNVEIKNLPVDRDYDPTEEIVELVLAAIDAAGMHDTVIVSSFSLATVDATRATAPGVRTAFLTLPRWDHTRAVAAAAAHGHDALHPHVRSVDAVLVERVHAAGMVIHPWAVDDPDTARRMRDLGVDAIITDDPASVMPAVR